VLSARGLSSLTPLPINVETAQNGKQPRAQRRVMPERIERTEGTHEGVLHQLVHVVLGPNRKGKPFQRIRVALHQGAGGPLVSRQPLAHQASINGGAVCHIGGLVREHREHVWETSVVGGC
jgi:hypothetical protein